MSLNRLHCKAGSTVLAASVSLGLALSLVSAAQAAGPGPGSHAPTGLGPASQTHINLPAGGGSAPGGGLTNLPINRTGGTVGVNHLPNGNSNGTPSGNTPPSGSNPGGSNPGGSNPSGSNPSGSHPGGSNPGGSNPGGSNPGGSNPGGSNPGGSNPPGSNPSGSNPNGSNPSGTPPSGSTPGGSTSGANSSNPHPNGPNQTPGGGQCGGNGGNGGNATGTGVQGGNGGNGGNCTIIENNTTQVTNVSWSMPDPVSVSAPVYSDSSSAPAVQTVQAPPIVTCAMPFGTLYGHPVDPKLQPVVVDGVTVDYLPLCQTYTYEPYFDCATAYYYYADQNLFYCVVPA